MSATTWSAYDEGYLTASGAMPRLRLESSWAPLLYVFVHHLLDGTPPGVRMPDGLLESATAQGRFST